MGSPIMLDWGSREEIQNFWVLLAVLSQDSLSPWHRKRGVSWLSEHPSKGLQEHSDLEQAVRRQSCHLKQTFNLVFTDTIKVLCDPHAVWMRTLWTESCTSSLLLGQNTIIWELLRASKNRAEPERPFWNGPPRERRDFSRNLPWCSLHLQLPAVCPHCSR